MMAVSLICCVLLMLSWTGPCVSQQHEATTGVEEDINIGQTVLSPETGDAKDASTKISSPNTASYITPQNAPCFLNDILATLRESMEKNSQPRNDSLPLFAVCSDNSLMLLKLGKEASKDGLDVLYPSQVLLNEEEQGRALTLTFDPSKFPPMMLNPVLILGFQGLTQNLDITMTGEALNPHAQTVCISEQTKYMLLMIKEGQLPQKWDISVQTKSPDGAQEAFIGGNIGSHVSIYALLLFSTQRGTDTRLPHDSHWSHNSFLCELRRFLVHTLPQDPNAPLLNLESLQSLPPLPIGLSSSETLLAGLINSSGLTILSFTQGSMLHAHHEQLALSPALLEELRQRLEHTLAVVMEMIKDEDDDRATERLKRLKELCGFPLTQQVEGKLQYRAFLLYKALQTTSRALGVQRAQRATRANPVRNTVCALRSLTVSLQRVLVGPNTATINNCQGSCTFPMIRTNNHAVLLNSHIDSGHTDERAPCCVPVAYDGLQVVDLIEEGTFLTIKPDMVAKECECR